MYKKHAITMPRLNRLKLANDNQTTANELSSLIIDPDPEISTAAAKNPNIDETILNILLDDKKTFSSELYFAFFNNPSFKKEWLKGFLEYLESINITVITLQPLYNKRFYNNDDEWLEYYKLIFPLLSNRVPIKLATFWFNFFSYPRDNYSEKVILQILEDFGQIIDDHFPSTFKKIINTPMDTPKIRNKIYSLTKDNLYLPEIAKDVFIF